MNARDVDRSLRLAREVFSPSAAHREHVLAGLAARGVVGSTPGPASANGAAASRAAGAAAAATSAGSRKAGMALGITKATLLVGAGFALGYWVAEARGPEAGLPAAAPSAVTAPQLAAPRVTLPEPVATLPGELTSESSATPQRGARRAHAASSTSSERYNLADELALLQRAERAIRAGNGALARSFIADLEARFPKTALQQERAAVLVLAACALGEPTATSDARVFVEHHAGSVYIDRIRTVCRLEAPQVNGSLSRGH